MSYIEYFLNFFFTEEDDFPIHIQDGAGSEADTGNVSESDSEDNDENDEPSEDEGNEQTATITFTCKHKYFDDFLELLRDWCDDENIGMKVIQEHSCSPRDEIKCECLKEE